jgi:hypothetical protein
MTCQGLVGLRCTEWSTVAAVLILPVLCEALSAAVIAAITCTTSICGLSRATTICALKERALIRICIGRIRRPYTRGETNAGGLGVILGAHSALAICPSITIKVQRFLINHIAYVCNTDSVKGICARVDCLARWRERVTSILDMGTADQMPGVWLNSVRARDL